MKSESDLSLAIASEPFKDLQLNQTNTIIQLPNTSTNKSLKQAKNECIPELEENRCQKYVLLSQMMATICGNTC